MKGLTIFFPVYNDEATVKSVALKALSVADALGEEYEVLIIDDGSPDSSGEIARQLSNEYPRIRLIAHDQNRGYGAALKTGFSNAKYDWICATDGDDEYDLRDLFRLWRHKDFYDALITFRYVRMYSNKRVAISVIYNIILRVVFRTRFRDISTGLRLVSKRALEPISLTSNSPFIGSELAIKLQLEGFRVGEIGIQTFPRKLGKGSSTSLSNIYLTILDILRVYKEVFSSSYCNPRSERQRED